MKNELDSRPFTLKFLRNDFSYFVCFTFVIRQVTHKKWRKKKKEKRLLCGKMRETAITVLVLLSRQPTLKTLLLFSRCFSCQDTRSLEDRESLVISVRMKALVLSPRRSLVRQREWDWEVRKEEREMSKITTTLLRQRRKRKSEIGRQTANNDARKTSIIQLIFAGSFFVLDSRLIRKFSFGTKEKSP